jgi:hypothetical protein
MELTRHVMFSAQVGDLLASSVEVLFWIERQGAQGNNVPGTTDLASPAYFMTARVPESLAPLVLAIPARGIAMRRRFGSMDGMRGKRGAAVTLPGRFNVPPSR